MSTSQIMHTEKLREKYVAWWTVAILTVPVILDFFFFGTQIARLSRVIIFAGVLASFLTNHKLFMKSKMVGQYSVFLVASVYVIGTVSDLSYGGVLTPNFVLLLLFLVLTATNMDLYKRYLDATIKSFHLITALSAVAIVLKLNPRGYYASAEGYPVYLDFIGIPGRNYGILPHPNTLGQVASISFLIMLTAKANKLLWLIPIFCIAKCGSRTALIGIGVSLVVHFTIWMLRKNKSKRKSAVLESPIAIGAFIVGIFLASSVQFLSFIGLLDPNALTSRVSIWQNSLTIFQQSPLFGTGWGWEFRAVQAQLLNVWATSAHNAILDIVFSTGFAGLTIFLILMAKVFVYFKFLSEPEKLIFCFLIASGISETFVDLQYPTMQTYAFFLIVVGSNRKASIID
jgi:O-antigen ligase